MNPSASSVSQSPAPVSPDDVGVDAGTPAGPSVSTPGTADISLLQIVNATLRRWRLFVIFPLVAGFAAVVYGLIKAPTYSVTTSFVPQLAQTGGDLAGLARQFGVNLGGQSFGQSPDFYAMLMTTRTLLVPLLDSTYTIDEDGSRRTGTLIQLYGIERPDADARLRAGMKRLVEDLDVSIDRPTGKVEVVVTAPWPSLAEQIAGNLLALVNEFNLQARQSEAQAEADFAKARLQEAQNDLAQAEAALTAFAERNRHYEQSPELVLERERLQRQVSLRQQVYVSLVQVHEQARMNAVRDVPMITVLERPEGAAVPNGRRLTIRAALGIFLGLAIAVILMFLQEMGRLLRASGGEAYEEFIRLRREVLRDLRWPARLLSGRFTGRNR